MCLNGAVTFLETRESLKKVDPEFRNLVQYFHRIPFCATFGVSCAGHFGPVRYNGEALGKPKLFYPSLCGSLCIIFAINAPHMEGLKQVISDVVSRYEKPTFKRFRHPFGPKMDNRNVEVWEIRFNNNDLPSTPHDGNYPTLSAEEYPQFYKEAAQAARRLRKFWRSLERAVMLFADKHKFKETDIMSRMIEVENKWHSYSEC